MFLKYRWKVVLLLSAFSLLVMGIVGYLIHFAIALVIVNKEVTPTHGMLYPRESETREVRSLDGLWNFVTSDEANPTQGVRDKWFNDDLSKVKDVIPMPVPASYNDITTDKAIRDHVGTVWYDRKFFVPRSWAKDQRVWLRFGSVHYEAFVWVNGEMVVKHEMGHLPFEAEVSNFVKYGEENRITVMCDNALIQTTVPQGKISEVKKDGGVAIVQSYTFDFFNYAGIHRSVHLYTTPKTFIEEVEVTSNLAEKSVGHVYYKVKVSGTASNEADSALQIHVQLYNKEGVVVANGTSNGDLNGALEVKKVKPWWPYLMHPEPGYLYQMELLLYTADNTLLDVYRLKVGIRTLTWNNSSFLINGRPVYFRGFGKHEDSDIRGKGLDLALLTRDMNLLKWIGANAYRTSHYPYSEESMQFADENGLMIIDECPSVDTDNYNQALLDKHKSSMEQLIHRDRNHPSVIMWSIANEPRTSPFQADSHFQFVANFTRSLDSTRPVTAAIAVPSASDRAAKHLDIICFNRYNGWYSNPGKLDMITTHVVEEAITWNKKHNKPVMIGEYGADTIEGLHLLPAYIWSEEYQNELFSKHFKAFDKLRKNDWFIGEFVWNFADFKTAQSITRVGGNKKGVFTRNRQPKATAHLLRKRYFALGRELDRCEIPEDLFLYITDATSTGSHGKRETADL
ncbi:beta-glucuronidase isoform X1 [Bactrocera neohumeralis]|uniref:beta-glucuronidase isoform X1 n=2 Tax=Bactrocera neohumeralis TaxID=98809 RepID=UPI0021665B58|nr:beta-glucuronidase isoform X1 [Bactrocera neohumeralis]